LRSWMAVVRDCVGGRYQVLDCPPLYLSDTTKIRESIHIYSRKKFCVKEVTNPNVLLREIGTRNQLRSLPDYSKHIVDDIWNSTWTDEMWKGNALLCLVMVQGEKTLFDTLRRENFAGRDVAAVQKIAKNAAEALYFMNSNGFIHGDFKPRNLVKIHSTETHNWRLIDLDSSIKHGNPAGIKASSGYAPPELAKFLFGGMDFQPIAAESYDVWSFGLVFFELTTGVQLFTSLDSPHDDIIMNDEKIELVDWHNFPAASTDSPTHGTKLELVFSSALDEPDLPNLGFNDLNAAKDAAKDLIRKCLEADPGRRPTFDEILKHHFFSKQISSSEEAEVTSTNNVEIQKV